MMLRSTLNLSKKIQYKHSISALNRINKLKVTFSTKTDDFSGEEIDLQLRLNFIFSKLLFF
jgi:hypothetical protein